MHRDVRGWRVAPAPDGRGRPDSPAPRAPHRSRGFLVFALALLVINFGSVLLFSPAAPPRVKVPFSPYFITQVTAGRVASITSTGDAIDGTLKSPEHIPGTTATSASTTLFSTEVPSFWNNDQLSALLQAHGTQINAQSTTQSTSLLISLLLGFGPTLLIVGVVIVFMRRAAKAGGSMGALSSFGRSKARRVDPATIRATFADVAGIDEAKSELTEIVDFLRDPTRYGRLGGRMPHGVLLSGAPGTGKTLLARAVAGEAHAAFFSISASEFIEAIVGVGASRVRDLFTKAKEAAPAIIFIDELDAIGRSRQGSVSLAGANDEREQTLNQILTELDGFEPAEAVIVLAATNRPEILDSALMRPGRFDRRVAVQPPDRQGRKQILEVHTKSIPLAAGIDLEALAASTPGMVGADLAQLANEAALLAARRNHHTVQTADFTDSLEKILLGAPRGIVLSTADRERTAFHEAGHALVGMLTPGADPVRKVSIIPRGLALGVTLAAPDDDQVSYTREDLIGKIKVALGGRVAEETVYGTITTGAESDIERVTAIARQMVGRWGMSEAIGFVSVISAEARGPFISGQGETSEATQQVVDEQVRLLIDSAHREVSALIGAHRVQLESLARALLQDETLDESDAYSAAGMPGRSADAPPVPAGAPGTDERADQDPPAAGISRLS
ncbi:ATP-dependent zinc metalloprotease FtsH [Conexibacter sp. DBS9H8]|uniref:ATP-dependent zinc metalloprotease FtsH n=1 Tax=Conexibacter sp. DBS9H8 TaxID=2937801 RepID=UPI00200ED0E1|nr:ATP-dependent zinc metalloprotease FtsH [Conexibacter sp. DBS9H8]